MAAETMRSVSGRAWPAGVPAVGRAAWRQTPLDDVGLNPRISRRLVAAGISTLGDLAEWTPEALRSLPGIHAVSVLEIELCLVRAQNAKRPAAGRTPCRHDPA